MKKFIGTILLNIQSSGQLRFLGSRLLAVFGKLERQGEVTHLIAGRLKDLTPLLGKLVTQSRVFH